MYYVLILQEVEKNERNLSYVLSHLLEPLEPLRLGLERLNLPSILRDEMKPPELSKPSK